MNCYYLIASLPRLMLDEKPLLSAGDFRALCLEQMGGRDARVVEVLAEGPDYGTGAGEDAHPFVAAWQAREIQLRNAVVRARAERRKTDAASSIRPHSGFDTTIEDAVESAFELPTPLEREKALDRLRWRILDELVGVDPFSAAVVLAYAVKLRLAWRWAALDPDRARNRVKSVLEKAPLEGAGSTPSPEQAPPDGGGQQKVKES
jgi:hypothetical protein